VNQENVWLKPGFDWLSICIQTLKEVLRCDWGRREAAAAEITAAQEPSAA
jgi:hypothetical protein